MKHLKAFTLIEMMVTMSLFSISMLAILAILSSSIGLIQKFYRDDSSRFESDLFLTHLDLMTREAVRADSFSVGQLNLYYGNGKHDNLTFSTKEVRITSFGTKLSQKKTVKKYFFKNAKYINISLIRESPPQAIRVSLGFDRGVLQRTLLLGYQKQ